MTQDLARRRVQELEDLCSTRLAPALIAELASCYFTLGDPERALPLAKMAWEWNRKDAGFGMNLAMIYKDLGRHEESFHVIETAYWNNPDDFYIQLGYGEALLRAGFWKQAWPIYDNSRPTQSGAAMDLRVPSNVKEWDGRPLTGQHQLLVINEGGTGDRISYARWLPELTKRGINWRFYPYSELYPFYERIFPREQLVADGEDCPEGFSHWATTFSLPAKLNCSPTEIPPPLKFTADPMLLEKYKLGRSDNLPVIGLCYRAAELFQGGRTVRSLTEGQGMRLVCVTGDKAHYINLQFGQTMPQPVINVNFSNWQDTAALLQQLDAVVTVDTGICHLAGAMGKPMALLLSGNSCWKWLQTGKRAGLYPSANVYRNEAYGFEKAVDALVADIRSGAWPQPPPKSF